MKALSFLQPWAHAVLHLQKDLDNRCRKDGRMPGICKYRGPLLIHASAGNGPKVEVGRGADTGFKAKYFDWAEEWMVNRSLAHWRTESGARYLPPSKELPRGGIVGRCVVVAHVTPEQKVFLDAEGKEPIEAGHPNFPDLRWHMEGSFGIVLRDVEALPFVATKGRLSPWEEPADRVLWGVPPAREPRCLVCEGKRVRPSDTTAPCRNCMGSGVSPTVNDVLARGPNVALIQPTTPRFLFLDIDGVLNDDGFLRKAAEQEGGRIVTVSSGYMGNAPEWDPTTHIDADRVARLNTIIERTGAKVVLSTSWRIMGTEKVAEYLKAKGFKGLVVDSTPRLHGRDRFVEIRRWLEGRSDSPQFAILDDDRDAGVTFDHQYIHVPHGLEDEHVERAVRILS